MPHQRLRSFALPVTPDPMTSRSFLPALQDLLSRRLVRVLVGIYAGSSDFRYARWQPGGPSSG